MFSLSFDRDEFLEQVIEADRTLKYTFLINSYPLLSECVEERTDVKGCLNRALSATIDFVAPKDPFYRFHKDNFAGLYDLPKIALESEKEDEILGRERIPSFAFTTLLDHILICSFDVIDSYISLSSKDSFYSSGNAKADRRGEGYDHAGSLISKIDTHIKILENMGFGKPFTLKGKKVPRNYADLFYSLIEVSGKQLGQGLRTYSTTLSRSNDLYSCWNSMVDIYNEIKDKAPKNNGAERILYLHRLESLFGVELTSVIVGNIIELKKMGFCYPDGINDFQLLSNIYSLPNTFSRTYYAQYAIQSIKALSLENRDEYRIGYRGDNGGLIVVHKEKQNNTGENITPVILQWNQLLQDYYRYITAVTIPLSFWSFFINLIQCTNAFNKEKELDLEILGEIRTELQTKINERVNDIENIVVENISLKNTLNKFAMEEEYSKEQIQGLKMVNMLLQQEMTNNSTKHMHLYPSLKASELGVNNVVEYYIPFMLKGKRI